MTHRSCGSQRNSWFYAVLIAVLGMMGLAQPVMAATDAPTVKFSSDTPDTYVKGSGEAIAFNVDGDLPAGDVLVLAWSHDEQRMVDEFAYSMTEGPWQISAEQMDKLPDGRVQLQLLRRVPDAKRTIARQWINIRSGTVIATRTTPAARASASLPTRPRPTSTARARRSPSISAVRFPQVPTCWRSPGRHPKNVWSMNMRIPLRANLGKSRPRTRQVACG